MPGPAGLSRGGTRRRKSSRRRGGTQCPARLALALSPPVSLSESRVKDNEHMTGGGALSSALRRRPRSLRRAATGGSAAGDPRASRRMSGAAPWSRRSFRAALPCLRSRGRRRRFDAANRACRVAGASGTTGGPEAENRETEDDFRPAFFGIPPMWEGFRSCRCRIACADSFPVRSGAERFPLGPAPPRETRRPPREEG